MSRKLMLASAVTLILAGPNAHALGLGGLHTYSALNQPFVGEIELYDINPDELDQIKIKLASEDDFKSAGIERYYYLRKLRFSPQLSAQGKPVIRITSQEPMREPFLDFLIEATWPQGQLTKDYTALLDPPVSTSRRVPEVHSPKAQSVSQSSAPERPATPAQPRERATSAVIPVVQAQSDEGFPLRIGPVRAGMGLWRLARAHKPTGATVAQTAMALFRNNQHAFIKGDINRLLVGAVLTIPTQKELFALDPAAAEEQFKAALRGEKVARAPLTEVPSPDADKPRLKIAGAAEDDQGASQRTGSTRGAEPDHAEKPAKIEKELLTVIETSETTRQETNELRERIHELESQLQDIQSLLQLRNEELKTLKGKSSEQPGVVTTDDTPVAPETPAESTDTTPDVASDSTPPAQTSPDVDLTSPSGTEDAQASGETMTGPGDTSVSASDEATDTASPEASPADSTEPAADQPATTPASTASTQPDQESASTEAPATPPSVTLPEDLTPAVVTGKEDAASDAAQGQDTPARPARESAPAVTTPPPARPAEPEKQSMWHALLLPLAGIAGAVVLGILGYSWWSSRRRREEGEDDSEVGVDTVELTRIANGERISMHKEEPSESVESATAPLPPKDEIVDDEDELSSSTFESSLQLDSETTEADVLSEADIYLAYGRVEEAERLLQNELTRTPDRMDIKFKLAEAYYASKKGGALSDLMESIRSSGGDQASPDQWERVLEMAREVGEQGGEEAPTPASGPVLDQSSTPVSAGAEDSDSMALELDALMGEEEEDDKGSSSLPALDDLLVDQEEGPSTRHSEPVVNAPDPEMEAVLEDKPDAGAEHSSDLMLSLDDLGFDDDDLKPMTDVPSGFAESSQMDVAQGGLPVDVDSTPLPDPTSMADSTVNSISPPTVETGQSEFMGGEEEWEMDSGMWDENATKLDLARAYIDMDDKDAARSILEEVQAEGRDDQRQEAAQLLARIN